MKNKIIHLSALSIAMLAQSSIGVNASITDSANNSSHNDNSIFSATTVEDTDVSKVSSFSSPDGKIKVTYIGYKDGKMRFAVERINGNAISKVFSLSDFGVKTSDGGGNGLRLLAESPLTSVTDDYRMITGKKLHCTNSANERSFDFIDQSGKTQRLTMRAYNDGVVFRYTLVDGYHNARLVDESTVYQMQDCSNRWLQKFDTAYEQFFLKNQSEAEGNHWAYPSLFESYSGVFTLVTEANIMRKTSGSSMKYGGDSLKYKVYTDSNQSTVDNGWTSPWRVAIIGSLSDIVESTLVTDVSEPCKLEQTQWIRPGVVSWVYWAYNRGSKDFRIVSQYIDMAATLKLPYVLIDWEWDVMSNGGNIDDALALASKNDVRTLLWYNSSTAWVDNGAGGPLYRLNKKDDREKEFAWLRDKGVAGVKIDFFSGDTHETMDYCLDLLETASKYNLLVNLHGATMPRGWQRTYPHLMTTEAVYGAEWYNNAPVLTEMASSHNATLPFTRGVVGSMDYTPCTFSDSQHPHITTNAHELALTVIFESGLQHLADRPSSYLEQSQEIRNFLSNLPTVWDETRLIGGYPGEYVAMARRSGDKWYIGVINGTDSDKEVQPNYGFINEGNIAKGAMIADGDDADNKWVINEIKANELPKTIRLKPRGGFVAVVPAR